VTQEPSTSAWARHREAVLIGIGSAVAGAAASKLVDASLPVLLEIVVAVLFGALVATLAWLRRDARDARMLASSMTGPLARAEARLSEINERAVRAAEGPRVVA
jgi:hypothetical protein